MVDTLELIDLQSLESDLQIACQACENEGRSTEASWSVTHGNPTCIYFMCSPHSEVLRRMLLRHAREMLAGKCTLHCQQCGDNWADPEQMNWTRL